ncbi:MAG: hypothetical protein LBU55_05530 [Elusimicrobiota bacterium]|jgi:16S rRNA processing protein RimM|nr:hypothetical protein [Elusimicrobiota bacterium]
MEPPDKKFKWNVRDILGFVVFDQDGVVLGTLSGVIYTGSNDVWVVSSCDGEFLVPALIGTVREVNVLRKKVFVFLPDECRITHRYTKVAGSFKQYVHSCHVVYED